MRCNKAASLVNTVKIVARSKLRCTMTITLSPLWCAGNANAAMLSIIGLPNIPVPYLRGRP